jgi:hypothetical protein
VRALLLKRGRFEVGGAQRLHGLVVGLRVFLLVRRGEPVA